MIDATCTDGGDTCCDVPRPICTGVSARWCPLCGDCTCPFDERHGWGAGVFPSVDDEREPYDDECPLHGVASQHAEGEHER